jgi:hypothetical protein
MSAAMETIEMAGCDTNSLFRRFLFFWNEAVSRVRFGRVIWFFPLSLSLT